MATVIRKPADPRSEILGVGFGNLIGNMIAGREAAKQKKAQSDALAKSAEIFQKAMRGATITEAIPEEDRQQAALAFGGGPTRTAASFLENSPRERRRQVGISDVLSPLAAAGVDTDAKFAVSLATAIEESRSKRIASEEAEAAFSRIFEAASKEGAKRSDLIGAISTSGLDATRKIQLLQNVDKILPADEDEEESTIEIYAPGADTATKVSVSKDVAGTLEGREEFVRKNFPGFSTTPPKGTDKLTGKPAEKRFFLDVGFTDEQATNLASDRFVIRGPDAEGRFAIFDRATNSHRFVGGDQLTAATLREVEQRIISITDAVTLLRRTDTKSVGLGKILAAEVGGVAVQVPVIGSIMQALGFSEEEIGQIQADRGDFFAVLGPIVQSFAQDGDRRSLATKTELGLSERILNMTRLSSTPGGAEIQKKELINLLTDIRARLIAQRLTRSVVPPTIVSPEYIMRDDNTIGVK